MFCGESRNTKKIGRSKSGYKRNQNNPLYRAMKKYGLDNFSFDIIERCEEYELSDREIYWIDYYNCVCFSGHGYNQTLGGEYSNGYAQRRKVYQYDLDGNFLKEYDSIKDATVAIGANRDNGLVQNAVGKKNAQAGGFQWSYEYVAKMPEYIKKQKTCMKVARYNADWMLIDTFSSALEAANEISCEKSTIAYNCTHHIRLTKGYMFEYFEDVPLETIPVRLENMRRGPAGKPVLQLFNGVIVGKYPNAQEAAKSLNGGIKDSNGANSIGKVCRKIPGHTKFKGFEWEFYNIDE